MKLTALRLVMVAMIGGMAGAAPVQAADDVVIVYDASGSMWGQIEGTSKIEIAREVMADLVDDWDAETNLGLIAYGHRQEGDCTDIETMVAPGSVDRTSFINTVNAITPLGKTPISASVQQAADLLSYRDTPATVVLISDGAETCNADPCALSDQLARQGVKFTVHVVGFDLDEEENASLSCIAENTGGVFVPASNADELYDAFDEVRSVMDAEPTAPEPEPAEPATPEVTLTGPEQVTTGAAFDVSWSQTISDSDMVAIVPIGADEGTRNNYRRTGDASEGSLTAPADPGLYELRYILDEGKKTLATVPIEVIKAEIEISGPEQATAGAAFDVSWSQTVGGSDMVAIVPVGADEGTRNNYLRTKDKTEGRLTAPAEPGLYELRYILDEGKKTLATAPIEVVEAEIELTGPAQATTGAAFDVSWSQTVSGSDMVAIVPVGADEGTRNNYRRTKDKTEGRLIAPAEPGLYELRYILDEGKKTLATAPIEVVEAEIGISGPGAVRAETDVDISWSATIGSSDMVAIVPVGADEGTRNIYLRTGDKTEGKLTAPAEPGLYEIRYILNEGKKTVAMAPLEVVGADAPLDEGAYLSVPKTAAPGATIAVSWTGESDSADQRIALARKDQPDFSWISVHKVAAEESVDITMPQEQGLYEVRFLDVAGRVVLGRAIVEVK
ncbi:vWA domain-containing protein [Stappia stellulata]|uniref:vWA domain-containing protein n=1 Tax=Stappia stellulata TaxID=71235 RepID=UPI0009FF6D45|nr:VWA domain-containing protein [Stappia stellulata]